MDSRATLESDPPLRTTAPRAGHAPMVRAGAMPLEIVAAERSQGGDPVAARASLAGFTAGT